MKSLLITGRPSFLTHAATAAKRGKPQVFRAFPAAPPPPPRRKPQVFKPSIPFLPTPPPPPPPPHPILPYPIPFRPCYPPIPPYPIPFRPCHYPFPALLIYPFPPHPSPFQKPIPCIKSRTALPRSPAIPPSTGHPSTAPLKRPQSQPTSG